MHHTDARSQFTYLTVGLANQTCLDVLAKMV
jgi:hypothetical protein